jgi:hypothetical protein
MFFFFFGLYESTRFSPEGKGAFPSADSGGLRLLDADSSKQVSKC